MAYSRYDSQLEKFLNPQAAPETLLDAADAVGASN